MKKIITAINNPKLNEELKKENNFEIVGKDIQYKEAIIETLEKNKKIDLIIISEQILGEINFEKLIEKIRFINNKIKIIFILEKENDYLEKILIRNNIKDIYYNNEINLFELIKIINKNEINMEEEIIKLKKIINDNNFKYDKKENNYLKNNKKLKNKNLLKINNKKNKVKKIKPKFISKNIITFSGGAKTGKTTLSLVISKYLSKMKYKVLLIDGDLEKQDLSIIIKNYKNKKNKNYKKNNIKIIKFNNNYFYKINNLNNYKINYLKIKNIINLYTKKIDNNFYFFNGLNILLNNKIIKDRKLIIKEINIFLSYIKNKYDFIIIELSKNNLNIINKEFLNKSNLNFIISEANILGINETNNLLNFYFNKLEIKNNNLQIILNKYNFISINKKLISNFLNFKNKIHKIRENKFYSILLNNYFKIKILLKNKYIKKDINKIIYEIEKQKY